MDLPTDAVEEILSRIEALRLPPIATSGFTVADGVTYEVYLPSRGPGGSATTWQWTGPPPDAWNEVFLAASQIVDAFSTH
jgi:hypothetical protein